MNIEGVKAILTDIEGTTSSISFVHDILFPYAAENIPAYVQKNEDDISEILDQVREIENNQSLTAREITEIFLHWISEDKKITPLKALQGLVWQDGYESGAFKGHIYDDAAQALQSWHQRGLALYIYSSGSIAAQKLIYGYSEAGDITPLLSGYFDTTSGPKLEAESYTKIAREIGLPTAQILFLSDHAGEITAADKSGYQTILVAREEKKTNAVQSFSEINIREKAA